MRGFTDKNSPKSGPLVRNVGYRNRPDNWTDTAHARAQHARRVLVEGGAEHGRDRQNDVPIDHPLVQPVAHRVTQL